METISCEHIFRPNDLIYRKSSSYIISSSKSCRICTIDLFMGSHVWIFISKQSKNNFVASNEFQIIADLHDNPPYFEQKKDKNIFRISKRSTDNIVRLYSNDSYLNEMDFDIFEQALIELCSKFREYTEISNSAWIKC